MKGRSNDMRRPLLFLLVASILIASIVFAHAQENPEGFQYRIEKDGTATITGYSGTNETIEIPNVVEGKIVTGIGNGAFYDNQTVKQVSIPEGITTIGNDAFKQCMNLISVKLPSTITFIGEGVFSWSWSLQSVNLPEGIKEIPKFAFSVTTKLMELNIPSSVQIIGIGAIESTGISSINLPDGLLTIEMGGIRSNPNLESIVIPNSVKEIGDQAFFGSKSLKSVVLPSGLTKINDETFALCGNLEKVAIPKSVKTIASGKYSRVFKDCYRVSIWGFKGSSAEAYAKNNDIPFVTVDPVQNVTLLLNGEDVAKSKLTIDLGSNTTLQFVALTSPENPWPGVIWKSSDAKAASVDSSGLVTGLKKGKVTITATAVDGSSKKASCEITISNLVKGISIIGEETIQAGKKTELKATVSPENADSKKLDWMSSDNSIATVDAKGFVTAKKVAEAKTVTITATAKDGSGVFASFDITVIP